MYNAPPTDPRLLAYTSEELEVEFLEYAIDNDIIEPGAGDNPAIVEMVGGIEVLRTGIKEFDEDEEWLRSQGDATKSLHDLVAEKMKKDREAAKAQEENMLKDIAALVLKERKEKAADGG